MNFQFLIPELTLVIGAFLLLIIGVFYKQKTMYAQQNLSMFLHFLAIVIVGLALACSTKNFVDHGNIFNSMIKVSPIICLAKTITLMLLLVVTLMVIRYVLEVDKFSPEFLSLLFLATTGGLIMISANDFFVFYTGLELQALSCYVLASFNRWSVKSSEAGIKYVILGSLASGLLLYGISLVYGYSGSTNFIQLNEYLASFNKDNYPPIALIFGFVLIAVALFFKIASAPFHMWAIDVYEGVPTAVNAFFGTVIKFTTIIATTIFIINLSLVILAKILLLVGFISVVIGSIGAIAQQNIKRLFAYSSVANVGFILLATSTLQKEIFPNILIYATIYSFISLGLLAFLNIVLSANNQESDLENRKIFSITALSGLSKTNPVIAFCLTIYLFSIAGIPPLAGFFAKFYAIKSIIIGGNIIIAIAVIGFTVISAFYYLRMIKIMYFDQPKNIIVLDDFVNAKFVIVVFAIFNLIAVFFIEKIEKTISSFL
jgi:NADH-quinone oxidoreductase subunit N